MSEGCNYTIRDLERFLTGSVQGQPDPVDVSADLKRCRELLYALAIDCDLGDLTGEVIEVLGEDRPVVCPCPDPERCETCDGEGHIPAWSVREGQ